MPEEAGLKGTVQVAVITIKPEEYQAVLELLPQPTPADGEGERRYRIAHLKRPGGSEVTVAVTRCMEQGNIDAQQAASDIVRDLDPQWILVVGIAGGVPSPDFSLGDVVIASRIYDLTLEASKPDGEREYSIKGEALHDLTRRIVQDIPGALACELQNWHSEVKADRPAVDPAQLDTRPKGDDEWRHEIKTSIGKHFAVPRSPLALPGAIASSDRLVKDPEITASWKKVARHFLATDMESAGVCRAAKTTPVLTIRGISDIVGLQRDEAWTVYACKTAAAFAVSLIRSDLMPLGQVAPSADAVQAPIKSTVTPTPEPPSSPEPNFPVFQVPFQRNPNFTGRQDILTALHDNLHAERAAALVQTIAGLGGVGKTQIAIEYAYRYCDEYDLVWWMRAETEETLAADYMTLANRLNLPVKTGADRTVFANIVRYWLENTTQKWLLVFDNAEQPDQLRGFLPASRTGQVLVTSRNPAWHGIANVLSVATFTPEEARQFLFRRTGKHEVAAADQLAELLGCLPLALAQAGAFIDERGLPLDAYARLYQEQRQELWERESPPLDYAATVTTTWELAFQEVRKASPAAIALLNLCAFLAPDDIPLSILSGGAAHLPKELAAVAIHPLELEEAIGALYRYSLITRGQDGLSIHRVVQDVVRERLGARRAQTWSEIAVNLMSQVFPFEQYRTETWRTSAGLMPHALAAIEHAEKHQAALVRAAALLQKTGEYLRQQGEFARARASIEHALAIRTRELGEEDIATVESLDYLGELEQEQANYSAARAHHEQALKIRQAWLGRESAEAAKSLNNLGLLLWKQGEYKQASLYCEEALAIRKEVLGSDHPDTARSLNNLGSLFDGQGVYERVKPYYEEALAIERRVLGDNHPDTATSLNNLGALFQAQGAYERARPYYEEALAICKRVLGDNHPNTAMSLNSLGALFQAQGAYERARPYYEEALAICKRVLGDNHPNTAMSLNNLGGLFQAQGAYERARPYYEEALAICKRVMGDNHPDTATSLNNLGALFQAQGAYERARPYYEEALAIRKRVLGDNHPDTAISLNSLGALFQAQGEYERARPYYEEALAIYKRVLGDSHPRTASSLNSLGTLFRSQGAYEQARLYYEEALAIRKRVLGDNHPDTARSLNNLGGLFQAQGAHERARPYFEEALAIRKRVLGDNHPDTAMGLNNLGGVLFLQGKYVAARPYLEQALRIYEKIHGEKHPHLITILANLSAIMFSLKQFELARRYLNRAAAICRDTQEQYVECQRVQQLLKGFPAKIVHGKGAKRHKKKK